MTDNRDKTLLDTLSIGCNGCSYEEIVKAHVDEPSDYNEWTVRNVDELYEAITADRKRVALEAEIAQLKSVVAGYEIYSHDATQFYKSIVKALLNKDERFYREYGEHALYQTDIDHLKAQQEEVK